MRQSLMTVLALICFVSPASAADPEFSADMAMTTGDQSVSAKVYFSKNRMRYDMPEGSSITHMDQGVTYVLLPAQKSYMKQAIDPDAMAKVGSVGKGELERVELGNEAVDGRPAKKSKVTYAGQGNGAPMTVYQWTDANDFPIKVQEVNGAWSVEYSHLVSGSQPESLFVVPSDYEEFKMPAMGDLQGLQGLQGLEGMQGMGLDGQGMDLEALKEMANQLQAGAGSERE